MKFVPAHLLLFILSITIFSCSKSRIAELETITVHDTIYVADTMYVVGNDTIYLETTDTLYLTITDTVIVIDTIFVDNTLVVFPGNQDEVFAAKRKIAQTSLVDSLAELEPFVGEEGTKVWLDRTKLMTASGDSVDWPYEVKLIELYSPRDMIVNDMPTTANGLLLSTGGQIKLEICKDGQEVFVRPGQGIQVDMSGFSDWGMQVFYGIEGPDGVDWTNDGTDVGLPDNTIVPFDSLKVTNLRRLGWINCDKFYNSATTNVINLVSDTILISNIDFYVYFPSVPGVMRIHGSPSQPIATGISGTIVGFAQTADAQIYGFTSPVTMDGDQTIEVLLEPMTQVEVDAMLDAL